MHLHFLHFGKHKPFRTTKVKSWEEEREGGGGTSALQRSPLSNEILELLLIILAEKSFQVGSQETSISGSQVSEPGTFEMDSVKGGQPISHSLSTISFPEAQRLTSLFFALCTKVCQ